MSRSGYIDDIEDYRQLTMYRGAVESAIRGKRGQSLLREMLAALDSLPEKKLIRSDFVNKDGEVCGLGAVGVKRGVDLSHLDPDDYSNTPVELGKIFDIAPSMAREIMHENDDGGWWDETAETRFLRVRRWVASQIKGGS